MKLRFRIPNLNKKIVARTSVKLSIYTNLDRITYYESIYSLEKKEVNIYLKYDYIN